MGDVHNASVRIGGKAGLTAKAKVGRFRNAVRAVHVSSSGKGWEVFRIRDEAETVL